MNKRGRLAFGLAVTIVLLASLILTAASVAAQDDLPDPSNPGPLLPPPALATATPTAVPEEEDGDDPAAEATATPTPRATTPPQGASPTTTRTTPTARKDRRGPCTLWTTASSDHGGSFPALSTPAGTVSADEVVYLLASNFSVNYGDGPFALSAAKNCTSVVERYLTHGVSSISECPNNGYGPWRAAGTYCVREIAPAFWR
ncbi:MAG: hypothetical protein F4X20_00550 [Dehalococcoidia bacterium]|nr:hypothetical protein [Dehalococcoidia bacterium]